MTVQSLIPSYPFFAESDGTPLESGYVYIGTAGLAAHTSPISVYFDSALTIPATQPLRTIAGRIVNSGSPANVYVGVTDYSLYVTDKNGTQISSELNKTSEFLPSGSLASLDVTGNATVAGNSTIGGSLEVSGNFTANNFNGENLLINSDISVNQLVSSIVSSSDGDYLVDGFKYLTAVTAATVTASQNADSPDGIGKSLNIEVTSPDATVVAGDYVAVAQAVDGYNYRKIAGGSFAISFKVKSDITGTYCISFRNDNPADRSYVAEYTIDVADTWEYKTVVVTDVPTGGTWDYDTGIGLYVTFALMAGSTYQTTADAWQTGNFIATSSQTNFIANNGAYFRISNAKLEKGEIPTPYVHEDIGVNLRRCKRYLRKSYAIGTAPGTATTTGSLITNSGTSTTNNISFQVQFGEEMRATPTIVIYSSVTGASAKADMSGGDKDATIDSESSNGFEAKATDAGGSSYMRFHYTADATL